MESKNYKQDISSVTTPVKFHLPDGSSQSFKTSTEAQQWFNQNYGNGYNMVEYVPTQGDSEHPIQLQEITITAQAPKQNKHFYGTSDFDALFGKSRVEAVRKAWQRNPQAMQNWTDGGNMAAAFVAAPFALEAGAAAYSVPEIAGALNLYGAYEGLGRLTSDEGVKKTWNHIQNGKWRDATKSAGGDVLDVAMSLPFLNRVRQGSKWLYNGAKGEVVNQAINRFSPNYSSTFNWRTGRFTFTPRPGVNVPKGTPVKFGPTQGLPSPTQSLPGSVSQQPVRTLSLGAEEAPTSSEGLSREGLYNTIDTYPSNIQEKGLTPEQTALIQSQFPIQSTYPNGHISFKLNNSADSPALQYDPLTGHVRIRGRGYNKWDGDITNLTQEMLQPKRIPEIITSSKLPTFSAISRGTDWGQILGVGGNYNSQIDFGLERPRPTFDQVVNTLGGVKIESPSNPYTDMTVYELGRKPLNDFPYLDLPNSIPIIHINLVPRRGEATLDWISKKWVGARMADLGRSAKGVDVASTEKVNPTLSRVVSDISAAQNLSELDRYNLLHEVITRPEQYFPSDGNWQDYSLFSYPENAVKGNSQRRFFTEPSLNFRTNDFNSIGLREGSVAAEGSARSFIDFLSANGFKGSLQDINDQQLIFEWLQKNAPQFYQTIDNKTFIPFPITAVKKKGGRIVKKFNLNGKKTCK